MPSNGRAFKSQGRLIERIERIVCQRFLCPTREARHPLRIAEALIPTGFIFADATPLFFLAKEEGVTKNRALCFRRESMDGFEKGGICLVGHG
jgi:hypothetical protein